MTKGFIIWLYGLPGSGKTTLADGFDYRMSTQRGFSVKRICQDQFIGTPNHPTLRTVAEWEHLALTLLAIAEQEARDGSIVLVECCVPFSRLRVSCTPFLEIYLDCHLGMCSGRERTGGILNQSIRKETADLKVLIPWVDLEWKHDPECSLDTDTDPAVESLEQLGYAFKRIAEVHGYQPTPRRSESPEAVSDLIRVIKAWAYWFPPGQPARAIATDLTQIAPCSHPAPIGAPCCKECAIQLIDSVTAICR